MKMPRRHHAVPQPADGTMAVRGQQALQAGKADAPEAAPSQPVTESIAWAVLQRASCPACRQEVIDPHERRYRYPFADCNQCQPRFSLLSAGQAQASVAAGDDAVAETAAHAATDAHTECAACAAERSDADSRRYQAPLACCHACGPRAWLERADGRAYTAEMHSMLDDVDAVCTVLQHGHLLALPGTGGFFLACDAGNAQALMRLRGVLAQAGAATGARFAWRPWLMMRDIGIVRRYCRVSAAEEALLQAASAPVVMLRRRGQQQAASSLPELPAEAGDVLCPGMVHCMLPGHVLHVLLMRRMQGPVALLPAHAATGGPPICSSRAARELLRDVVDYLLLVG